MISLKRMSSYDERNYSSGIYRVKTDSNKFEYFFVSTDKPISQIHLKRIHKLRIPPAWINVWISSDPLTTIQVIGTDTKGRKQYIYNEIHIKEAEKQKFLRLIDFIKRIPILDKSLEKDLSLPIYSKNRVIVTMLYIVKKVHMRVGKEQYARTNKSYGISSLKKKHVFISSNYKDDVIRFRFKGKSNQRLSYTLYDHEIKRHIHILLKLEGDKLFQYIDEHNYIRKVSDTDLNEYIKENMGEQFTIKDFRTYAANLYFIETLLRETRKRTPKNQKIIKKNIKIAFMKTAKHLKHTKSISKKSYVMNYILDLYQSSPIYFIERKHSNSNRVLLELLQNYKKQINI
jgi:DNA topoisomerase-1